MNETPRLLLASLLVTAVAAPLPAQRTERAQRIYRKNLEKKLAAPWLEKGGWFLDYGKALARAAKSKKPVFAFFSRSYVQDRACERVENGTFTDPQFRSKVGRHVVLFYHVSSRVAGRKNDGLLRQKVDRGERFPTMLFLDAAGNILFEQPRDKYAWRDLVATLDKVKKLMKAVAKGGKSRSAKADLLITKIELGMLKFGDAMKEKDEIGRLGGKKRKRLAGLLAKLEFEDLRDQRVPKDKLAARLLDMKKEKRIPAGEEQWLFYWYILEHAGKVRDTKLYKECLERVKDLKKYDKAFQRSIAVKEAELAKLKKRR